jgi:adenylate cyclase
MDGIYQWVWHRCGARYYWRSLCVVAFLVSLPVYANFLSFPIVGLERSDRYLAATAITVAALLVLVCIMALPNRQWARFVDQWAAGHDIDRMAALEATYSYGRRSSFRMVWPTGVWAATLSIVVGAIAGATWTRLIQYGILGAFIGVAIQLIAFHSIVEATLRPVRIALAGDTGFGDSLPRSRPTFAARFERVHGCGRVWARRWRRIACDRVPSDQ